MLNFIVIIIICMLAIISKIHCSKYKDDDNEDKNSYLLIGYYLYDIFKEKLNLVKISSNIRKLDVGNVKTINQLVRKHCARSFSLGIFIVLVANIIGGIFNLMESKESNNSLFRNDYGYGEKSYILNIESKYGIDEMTITIDEIQYSHEEFIEQGKETASWLDTAILKENVSLNDVISDLYFPQFNDEGIIEIKWSTDNEEIVSRKGIVNNQEMNEDTIVFITAVMTYREFEELYTFPVIVKKGLITGEEELRKAIASEIAQYDAINKYNTKIIIPNEIQESNVTIKNNKKKANVQIIFFGVLLSVLVLANENEKLSKRAKARDEYLTRSYPNLVNRLSLLIGAGETIKGALHIIALEKNSQEVLVREIRLILNEISAGVSEEDAYTKLGKRIGISPYLKLMGIISQNLKRGTSDIKRLLYEEQQMAFNLQKEYARKKGEEASTKLLLPMILLMVVVMVIIIYPAVVNFKF